MFKQPTPGQNETGIFANLTIPERNGPAKEMSAETAIPIAALAPPIQQAIPAERPEGEAVSGEIERRLATKRAFSFNQWYWCIAGVLVFLTGLVFGIGPCVVAVLLFVILFLVVTCVVGIINELGNQKSGTFFLTEDSTDQKSEPKVQSAAAAPSPAYKKCHFCAEAIRFEATLCRFCQKEQPVGDVTQTKDKPALKGKGMATAGEITYWEDSEATVTSTRAILNKVTYAMANITSVRSNRIEPDEGLAVLAVLAILIGIIGLLCGIGYRSGIAVAIGFVVAALGFWVCQTLKPSFVVVVGAAGGETHALVGKEKKTIDDIVNAISQAIIDRG